MKKLLLIALSFFSLSAKAMIPLEENKTPTASPPAKAKIFKFQPLEESEIPTVRLPLPMYKEEETIFKVGNYPTKFTKLNIETVKQEIPVTFTPKSGENSFAIPKGTPVDAWETAIRSIGGASSHNDLNLSRDHKIILPTGEVVIKKDNRQVLTSPQSIRDDIFDAVQEVNKEGQKKLLEKNKDLVDWTKSFLGKYFAPTNLAQENFINAAQLLVSIYGGTVTENPTDDTDVFLRVTIFGKTFNLKRTPESEKNFIPKNRNAKNFRLFLQNLGFKVTRDGELVLNNK